MSKINTKDLNQLAAFDQLMKTGSVSKAAQKMGVTQSAMSHILNRLRAEFDDVLLVKKGTLMTPTNRAKQLYESIKEPLAKLQSALDSEVVFEPETSDLTFTLATTDYFEMLAMPLIFKSLQQQAPGIKLRCRSLEDHQLSEIGHSIDFAFGHFSRAPDNLHRKSLWKEEFVCAASKQHPRLNKRLTLKKFIEERHILISPSGYGRSIVDKALAELTLKRVVSLSTCHFTTPIYTIMQTDLIATLPKRIVELYESHLQLYNPPLKVPGFDVHMLWSAISHSDPAHLWLRDLISQALADI